MTVSPMLKRGTPPPQSSSGRIFLAVRKRDASLLTNENMVNALTDFAFTRVFSLLVLQSQRSTSGREQPIGHDAMRRIF